MELILKTILLPYNCFISVTYDGIIIELHPKLNVGLDEIIHGLCLYRVYNESRRMDITGIFVSIFFSYLLLGYYGFIP